VAHSGFRTDRRGRLVLELSAEEVDVLDDLLAQLEDMLAPVSGPVDEDPLAALVGLPADAPAPTHPVLSRLLPDGYRDDPGAAADFRRYTEAELRAGKVGRAAAARASLPAGGGKAVLDEGASQAWLGALNDLRLALGTVLEVGDEDDEDDEPADEAVAAQEEPGAGGHRRDSRAGDDDQDDDLAAMQRALYDWLTYLQAVLVDELDARDP